MASEVGKLAAFFSGVLLFFGCLFVTAYPEWQRNSQQASEEYLRHQSVFEGVWWRCSSLQVGLFQCDNYDASLMQIPSDIQACRALTVIATIFSFIGLIISLLSLDCTNFVEPETKAKNVTALVAGICYIITALSCGTAVSWFAWRVTYEYYSPFYQQNEFKYEFGACLYVGWVVTLFAVISGLVLIIGSCKDWRNDEPDSYQPAKPYVYKPPTSTFAKPSGEKTEYV